VGSGAAGDASSPCFESHGFLVLPTVGHRSTAIAPRKDGEREWQERFIEQARQALQRWSATPRAEQATCKGGQATSSIPSEKEGESKCVVCIDNEATHAGVPCGHRCACATCAKELELCPLCRKETPHWLRIFIC
jgi:hypothetical protein